MAGFEVSFPMQFYPLVGFQTIILIELASLPVIRQENSMFIEFAPILDFPTKTSIFRHPGKANALTEFMHLNEAFVEIVRCPFDQIWHDLQFLFILVVLVRDFESQAMQSGSEDPEVANVLQKCEEYVPGKVLFDHNC